MVEYKCCPGCKVTKPKSEYHRSRSRSDGCSGYCKVCMRERRRVWYLANRERVLEENARWKAENPDRVRAIAQAWHAKNAVRLRAQNAAWYQANRARMLEARAAWRAQNPDYWNRWNAANPDAVRSKRDRRRANRMNAPTIPFTPDQLRERMRYWGNRCWVCGSSGDEVDHVKPLNKGGAHALCNLRPICRSCNARKRDTWPYPVERLKRAC